MSFSLLWKLLWKEIACLPSRVSNAECVGGRARASEPFGGTPLCSHLSHGRGCPPARRGCWSSSRASGRVPRGLSMCVSFREVSAKSCVKPSPASLGMKNSTFADGRLPRWIVNSFCEIINSLRSHCSLYPHYLAQSLPSIHK